MKKNYVFDDFNSMNEAEMQEINGGAFTLAAILGIAAAVCWLCHALSDKCEE
ncbi:MAG: class IIb bacteriocin, lactobin A/cerein 7B family [Spirochaetes bacterium]|nr:class IIb bacteriocin, lactobin A/cerein 7B family [Spirochaetota bacterium]